MKSFVFLFFLILSERLYTQTYSNKFYENQFDVDSLHGFDENAARLTAISENFTGSEFKIKMYRLKRDYINNKYNLTRYTIKNNHSGFLLEKQFPSAACNNEDFESSMAGPITTSNQIGGWFITAGLNDPSVNPGANSCNLAGCCPLQTSQSQIIDCTGGYYDVFIGSQYPIYSVFGSGTNGGSTTNPQIMGGMFGDKVIQLNNNINDYSIERLSKSFSVTPNDTLFGFAFLPVLSANHLCCDAAGVQITLSNSAGPINTYSFFTPSSQCTNTESCEPYIVTPLDQFYYYHKWIKKTINLKQYVGQTLLLEVTASDCNAGGHFGYTYFDAECRTSPPVDPFKVYFEQAPMDTGNVVKLISCSSSAAFYSEYPQNSWSGPTFSNVTTSHINIYNSGTYTLNAIYIDDCKNITVQKVFNITFFKGVKITSSDSIICLGESATLSSDGNPKFKWSTGDTTSSITVSPTNNTIYKLVSKDSIGCVSTSFFTVTVEHCTSINTTDFVKFKPVLYPNPNTGFFVLQLDGSPPESILVIESCLGQILHKQKVYPQKNDINIPGLESGVYYYRIIYNNVIFTAGKIIIE